MRFRDTKLFADNVGLLREGCEAMEMVNSLSRTKSIVLTFSSPTSISTRYDRCISISL